MTTVLLLLALAGMPGQNICKAQFALLETGSTSGATSIPFWTIIEWAGDLDGDGRLDLVVNPSRKYSLHPHRLLLSSSAAPGQLVGDVALFEMVD